MNWDNLIYSLLASIIASIIIFVMRPVMKSVWRKSEGFRNGLRRLGNLLSSVRKNLFEKLVRNRRSVSGVILVGCISYKLIIAFGQNVGGDVLNVFILLLAAYLLISAKIRPEKTSQFETFPSENKNAQLNNCVIPDWHREEIKEWVHPREVSYYKPIPFGSGLADRVIYPGIESHLKSLSWGGTKFLLNSTFKTLISHCAVLCTIRIHTMILKDQQKFFPARRTLYPRIH